MLRAALGFFVLAIVAMALGAGNVAGMSLEAGRLLLFIFLALAVLSGLVALVSGKSIGRQLPR